MPVFADIPAADPLLTTWALGAIPSDLAFIDRIAPVQRVPSRTGRYTLYDVPLAETNDRIDGFTDPWPQVRYSASELSYTIDPHGVEHPVPRLQDGAAYDQQRRNGVFITSRQTQFNKVKAYLDFLGDSANYGANTGSPTAKFNSTGTDVRAWFRAKSPVQGLGVRRNVAVMGEDVFEAILANDVFRDTYKGFRAMPSAQGDLERFVADYLRLEELIVLDLAYNTANPGQTASYDEVWPDETVAQYHRGPLQANADGTVSFDGAGRPLIEEASPGFIRQLVWTGVPGAPDGVWAGEVEDPNPGFGVTRVRNAQLYAPPYFQMASAGFLSTNVLA